MNIGVKETFLICKLSYMFKQLHLISKLSNSMNRMGKVINGGKFDTKSKLKPEECKQTITFYPKSLQHKRALIQKNNKNGIKLISY